MRTFIFSPALKYLIRRRGGSRKTDLKSLKITAKEHYLEVFTENQLQSVRTYYIKPITDNRLVNIWCDDAIGRSPSVVGGREARHNREVLVLLFGVCLL
jgi:hypothetical protein